MDNTLIRGDVNELRCILDFQERGYYCSIPFSGSCKYDVVVDIDNHLYRIQCKSSADHVNEDGTIRMSTSRQTTNTQKTVRYGYTKDDIDFFYTSWKEYSFLIPVSETAYGGSKYLRIRKPKNLQPTMNVANDYLLDNVLNSIINNQPIKKYFENRFISKDEQGQEKIWSLEELHKTFSERQIRYIKEKIRNDGTAYEYLWRYKEFPTLE